MCINQVRLLQIVYIYFVPMYKVGLCCKKANRLGMCKQLTEKVEHTIHTSIRYLLTLNISGNLS